MTTSVHQLIEELRRKPMTVAEIRYYARRLEEAGEDVPPAALAKLEREAASREGSVSHTQLRKDAAS